MSVAIRRILPLTLCSVAVGLFAGPACAQTRDPLPEVRERMRIEAQRVEKEVSDGRNRAYRLLRTDPEGAIDVVKGLIVMLRRDTALAEERRELLLQTLQRDVVGLRVLAGSRRTSDPAAEAARIEARRPVDPRVGADRKTAADTAASQINAIKGRVADARGTREKTGDRFSGTLAQVDKSATPPASDYDLPPDWLEKSKRRSSAVQLTEREKALLKALEKPVKVDYTNDTFQSVIDHLSKQIGQDILIDKQAMEEANVTYDTPITLHFTKPVSARTALRRVLADVGMTYVMRRENLEVTSVARAREMMTTRTYYIGDLMGVANPMLGPIANQYQMMQAIGTIIGQIQGIDADSWDTRGGPGTVTFDPIRMALVVRQSAEMHYMLSGIGGR